MRGLWVLNLLIAVIVLGVMDESAYFVVGETRETQAALTCSNPSRYLGIRYFIASWETVSQINRYGYGVSISGTGNNTVYASWECMKDLSERDCNSCINQCQTLLLCLPLEMKVQSGRVILDGCYLRYDDFMFFNESLSRAVDRRTVCGADDYGGNQTLFEVNVMKLVRTASVEGPMNNGFFTGLVSDGNLTVYGLAQCWVFGNGSHCMRCLEDVVSRIGSCPPKAEGRAVNDGCYMRYSLTQFYNNSAFDAPVGNGGGHYDLAIVVSSACGAVACLLIIVMVSLCVRNKILQGKRDKQRLGSCRFLIVNRSKINFSYERLEKATNYFHHSNKLGQGGWGSVYKGILSSGQTIAVKRLFMSTTQWVEQLFNEVDVISGIDHINLVKLLGCSVTGPESLLVYEYVPNQSLHDHLFGQRDGQPRMGWEERFKVVLGTAEGLAFLHEKSNLRIIHRDIKPSNVLLDEDFTPKIADFGLVRVFPENRSHISTAVAGTFGYMAPEYAAHGILTEKADVYSYGVLVVEVITGVKNSVPCLNSHSILHKVWNLNGTGKLNEAVDPLLKGKVPEDGAARVLEIGLICIQAAPELRPSMSTVVAMLTGNRDIPQPSKPPFFIPTTAQAAGQLLSL